jgi:hypothetical protein
MSCERGEREREREEEYERRRKIPSPAAGHQGDHDIIDGARRLVFHPFDASQRDGLDNDRLATSWCQRKKGKERKREREKERKRKREREKDRLVENIENILRKGLGPLETCKKEKKPDKQKERKEEKRLERKKERKKELI